MPSDPHEAASPAAPPVTPWALYAGLAFTTCSMLLVQQFLTRIYSILFNSGLAFLAISTTFLGLGSAGVAIYLLPRVFAPERAARQIPRLALAYSAALVGGLIAMIQADRRVQGGSAESLPGQVQGVLLASVLMLPAMILVGLVIALVLRAHAARVGKLYGADLAGGGIGCLLVLPLMNRVGGDQGIFVIGALAASGAALLARAHAAPRTALAAFLATCAFLAGPWLNRDLALVDVRSHSTPMSEIKGWVREDREVKRIWNALARLGIFEVTDKSSLYVRIDSACQTGIPSQDPEFIAQAVERADFERLPYSIGRHERYLEIGAGGGRGMQLAGVMGARRIVGVEINPGITSSSLGGFEGYGIGPWTASDPDVELITAEGRSHARGTDERFDTVTITFIQTGVANSSAAFALSEANLFTAEAITEFVSLLDDDGLFYVYRQGGNEMLRLVAMLRAALAERGIHDLRDHLYVARNPTNRSIMMAAVSPFTQEEVAALDAKAVELGLDIAYSPSGAPGPRPPNPLLDKVDELRASGRLEIGAVADLYDRFVHSPDCESLEAAYIKSDDPQGFERRSIVDVGAPTDDRPYYFFTGLSDWRDFPLYFDLDGVRILGGTVILLFWMAAAFTVLVLGLILVPLALGPKGRRPGGLGVAVLAYFTGLGAGYIAVQISFIQRFTLFLGHPVYAISVVLLGFLLSSGLGSMASDKLFRSGRASFGRALLALAFMLALYNLLLPGVFHSAAIAWPVAAKVLVALALIFPLAFTMGLFFPQGIRLVARAAPELTPWAWGANSAASILGSIFSLIFAIHFGFTATALAAAAIYLVFCYPASLALRRAAA